MSRITKYTLLHWASLFTLAFAHFFVDTFGGILPAVLPVIRDEFGLSLAAALSLITVNNFTANAMQIVGGYLRTHKSTPLMLPLGLVLAPAISLLAWLPAATPLPLLMLVVFISGCGIAIVHPEGLRAVHHLHLISPSVSTAVFMPAGFFGMAAGALVASLLVTRWHLPGLSLLLVGTVLGLILVYTLRIRLAVESAPANHGKYAAPASVPFFPLVLMALPCNIASTLIMALLPTRLHELGYPLSYGGLSSMLLGAGGAIGALFWAMLAHRRSLIGCTTFGVLAGIPILLIYMMLQHHHGAVWLLAPAGFGVMGVFPGMVTMARYAKGLTLGTRLGLILGGTWGLASLVLMALAPVAQRFSVQAVLNFVWIGYLLSGLVGIWIWKTTRSVTHG